MPSAVAAMPSAVAAMPSAVASIRRPVRPSGSDPAHRPSATELGAAGDRACTAVRAGALAVVVGWHWVFATVRWDGHGPHTGNPLHVVPAGFLLTWFLQVMPLFFLIGGRASHRSLVRHLAHGHSSTAWVRRRVERLVRPVLPLAAALLVAKALAGPWLFGVVLLAASPLWFLAVYVPLTIVTPLLVRAHRRSAAVAFCATAAVVVAVQVARFAGGWTGPAAVAGSLLAVWGFVFQVGFHLDRLRTRRRHAAAALATGAAGMVACGAAGLPLSMVAVRGDAISNMGPPTAAIVFLAMFQAGLVCLLAPWIERVTLRDAAARLVDAIDARQMQVYAIHLPVWVAVLVALRGTRLALAVDPTWAWLLTRPLWLCLPGALLVAALHRPHR